MLIDRILPHVIFADVRNICFCFEDSRYLITYKKEQRRLAKEIILGLYSSMFLGSGLLFFFLAVGIYL